MNNYYTLHSLVAEVRYEISGKEIMEVWSSRKDQIDFFFRTDPALKLTFSAASPGTALFLDGRAAPPSHNAAGFFPELEGCTVADVAMATPGDRYMRITFQETALQLLFMPFSSRPNVFLVKEGRILSSFKNSRAFEGAASPVSGIQDKTGSQDIPSTLNAGQPLRKKIIAIDRQFPRGIINDVADTCDMESLNEEDLRKRLAKLREKLLHPEIICITAEGNLSLLPPDYLSHPPEKTFQSVNDAVRTLFLSKNRERRLLPRKRDLEKKMSRRISGLRKQMEQFEKEPERLQKAEEMEQAGHLLMSQPNPGKKAVEDRVVVSDWNSGGSERVIPVTPGETLIHQAREYYARAARIRKEISLSGKIKSQIAAQLEEMEQLLAEVEAIEYPAELEKWVKKQEARLQQYGLAPSGSQQVARPYKIVKIGEYEVWIGKNAKSNDEILALSHKEDIWMHARGTAGSHVLLRTGGGSGWPDARLIRKAASFAAAYSRQAGSSMVPVMIAKRKHVRKPKGAAPGLVTVTREKVEMVAPAKPDSQES
ncbi:MAG: DUF814 domain-containing protein [Balneolaceae bacterium]|nr:MAG: DUF814 domain-containing protein [Balneolaceae bacterium]